MFLNFSFTEAISATFNTVKRSKLREERGGEEDYRKESRRLQRKTRVSFLFLFALGCCIRMNDIL